MIDLTSTLTLPAMLPTMLPTLPLASVIGLTGWMDVIVKGVGALLALATVWRMIVKPLNRIMQLVDAQLKNNGGGSLVDKVGNMGKQLSILSTQQDTMAIQLSEATSQLASAKESQDRILRTQHQQERNQRSLNSRIGRVEQQIKEIQQKANITSEIDDATHAHDDHATRTPGSTPSRRKDHTR